MPMRAANAVDVDTKGGAVLDGDEDQNSVDRLEPIDAAEERGLAAAGRADEAHDLVLGDREADAWGAW